MIRIKKVIELKINPMTVILLAKSKILQKPQNISCCCDMMMKIINVLNYFVIVLDMYIQKNYDSLGSKLKIVI